MKSQTGYQRITIHKFINIARIKGSQTVKFGQQNMTRETFLFKNHT